MQIEDLGQAQENAGTVIIKHLPAPFIHSSSLKKSYSFSLRPNSWGHFRFKMKAPTFGVNMYTEFYYKGKLIVQLGIYGEQHWKVSESCGPKEFDDEMFMSSAIFQNEDGAAPGLHDVRINFPSPTHDKVHFTEWTIFSFKIQLIPEESRLRIFVNGRELIYHDLDVGDLNSDGASDGFFSNRAYFQPGFDSDQLRINFNVLIDGDGYSNLARAYDIFGYWGVRYRSCYALYTPAIPSNYEYVQLREKAEWMEKYDVVNKIIMERSLWSLERIYQEIEKGSIDLETAILMEAVTFLPFPDNDSPIKNLNDWEVFDFKLSEVTGKSYMIQQLLDRHSQNRPLLAHLIWEGIINKKLSLFAAVMMNAIPLPSEGHSIWQDHPP